MRVIVGADRTPLVLVVEEEEVDSEEIEISVAQVDPLGEGGLLIGTVKVIVRAKQAAG